MNCFSLDADFEGPRAITPERDAVFVQLIGDTIHIRNTPRHLGGALAGDGLVEVVSSLQRDGQPVERDLRWGVYVVFKAESDYAASCFKQYGLPTDSTGRYAAMYKPYHLIGLELSISVLNVALRADRDLPRMARRRSHGR